MADKRMCYCGKAEKKVLHEEGYWLIKKVCKAFDDMGAI
jgi:hypothetical protein